MNYNLVDRLKEFSTYEGLVVIMGIVGYSLTDAQLNTIGAAAAAIYGVIKMFKPEKNKSPQ